MLTNINGVLDERDYAAYVDSQDGKLDGQYIFDDEGNAQTNLYSDERTVAAVREQMIDNHNKNIKHVTKYKEDILDIYKTMFGLFVDF